MGLGIRKVEWHPTGDWLAVGGWDGKVRSGAVPSSNVKADHELQSDSHSHDTGVGGGCRVERPEQGRFARGE